MSKKVRCPICRRDNTEFLSQVVIRGQEGSRGIRKVLWCHVCNAPFTSLNLDSSCVAVKK